MFEQDVNNFAADKGEGTGYLPESEVPAEVPNAHFVPCNDILDIEKEDDAPSIVGFKDHFTLQIPTSTIRFRDRRAAARIIEAGGAQFVLQETYDNDKAERQIEIRRIVDASEGVRLLRLSYALVTVFFTGFLFVFCLQILLYLVLDLAIDMGTTGSDAKWGNAMGTLLVFPTLVYGFASTMVIAGSFVMDAVYGHHLARHFAFRGVSPVKVEWFFFVFFLGLPLFVMGCLLLDQNELWWEVTLLFWLGCVGIVFVGYAFSVVWYEIRACWEVIRNGLDDPNDSVGHILRRCILLRQVATYSGLRRVSFLSWGTFIDAKHTDRVEAARSTMVPNTYQEHESLYTKLTLNERWGLFHDLKGQEEQMYSIEDARDVRPYVTRYTWSLEKIFCRKSNSRYIAIVNGPGSVTRAQMRSSMACSWVGSVLFFFLVLSILVFLQCAILFILSVVLVLGLGYYVFIFQASLQLQSFLFSYEAVMARRKQGGDQGDEEEDDDDDENPDASEGLYLVQDVKRITKPSDRVCWIMFGVEVVVLFVYPMLALLLVKNAPLELIFVVVSGLSLVRYYVNAAVVLEETGHMNLVDGKNEELWKNQSRLNEIMGNITRGRSRKAWMLLLGFFGLVFVVLMLGTIVLGAEPTTSPSMPYKYSYDFFYDQKDSLRYPTCQLTSDLGKGPIKSMADFAFMADLAYRFPNATQRELNYWFNHAAVDDNTTVTNWKRENGTTPVSFKLVTFPKSDNYSYVLIRGTQNPWDALTDAQLWSAAMLMQGLRELLPFGLMWTPVINYLIRLITTLESNSIERVSFYNETTHFVNFLLSQGPDKYAGISVTGHSLGGGLAMITGAQTHTLAVALSGPNSVLSGMSFDPPVSPEDLNNNTFNIIPDNDLVPRFDDPAQNFQQIRCTSRNPIECHSSLRSLCEIMYTCGSGNRPVLCECVTRFNYSEPTPKPGVDYTFAELCGSWPL